ncbi:ABC transporter ATP-binding protein [Paenibacillus algorifonticola]|uniref:ABC transporter ATP-binding protein n=1 Tax=Paenibacillus algorifonticola TaxID=684063 RepID=UPI003D28D6ED
MEQSNVVLQVTNLSKKIRGKQIIHDVSFEVRAGEIFGFLGPNGSGKTTTIRMLVDLIKPTSGQIRICGHDVQKQPEQALRHIGSIVENPEMYGYMTGWDNLQYFANMLDAVDEARISEVVEIVSLTPRIHEKVKTYSLGMKQRLGIAQALLGRPKLLILDEPTNGLDPLGIKELRAFVRMLAGEGISLFISSHLLSEIQLMCDRVAIIDKGRVLAVGSVDELVQQAGTYVLWQLEPREQGIALLLQGGKAAIVPEEEHRIDESVLASMPGAVVTTMPLEDIADTVSRLVAAGISVEGVHKAAPTLEELFLNMTEGKSLA